MEREMNIFMKGERIFIFLIFAVLLSGIVCAQETTSSFDLNSLVMKSTLTPGDYVSKVLTISRGNGQQVNLEVVGVKGVTLSESKFNLGANAENIRVNFNSSDLNPGVQVGSVKVFDSTNTYLLPIIFEVESEDVFYDANLDVPPQYSVISPGEKLVAQVKIFDLTSGGTAEGLGANAVNVEYKISDLSGGIVSSESENVVVNKQYQLTKTVTFPQGAKEGQYVISVVVKYKGSMGTASYLFSVQNKGIFSGLSGIFSGLGSNLLLIVVILVLFLFMVFFFVYFIKERDNTLGQLRDCMEKEYNERVEMLKRQEEQLRRRGVDERVVVAESRPVLRRLKEVKEKRKKEISKIEKIKDKKSREKKFTELMKKKGSLLALSSMAKGINIDDIRAIESKWKKKGYKFGAGKGLK